ncbi:MAG: DNA-3-methyladenine glycosylase I [Granulosicoccus sp.]|jgi:DNA-3-methyladenine glycosylase I
MNTTADKRCGWCQSSEVYIRYHDNEWGRPCHDSQRLFEMINLEGAQAGLSWITILNKREGYRKNFAAFDPAEIAQFTDAKLDKISQDPAIVRHRQKVYAVRKNAQALLELKSSGTDFSDFIWNYVDFKFIDNSVKALSDVPSSTPVSTQMSKDLKRLGFSFVGPTTCYAFMQAAGLVNDHLVSCPCYAEIS